MTHSMRVNEMTCKRLIEVLVGVPLLIGAGLSPAMAGERWGAGSREYYEYATVTDVQPIVRIVQVSTPREVCWDEPVRRAHAGGGRRQGSYTPTVVGSILGGVAGNKFGSGRGQDVMTVAGALLGASIGRDVGMQRQQSRYRPYAANRRCEIEEVSHEEERIDGYRVGYQYQGRDYVTQMREMPGEEIRVRVSVTPATGI